MGNLTLNPIIRALVEAAKSMSESEISPTPSSINKTSSVKLFLIAFQQEMKSYVLDGWESETGLLFHPNVHLSKQWVLLPRNNNWDQVHQFVSCFIDKRDPALCSSVGE